jgi:hypothetical protein
MDEKVHVKCWMVCSLILRPATIIRTPRRRDEQTHARKSQQVHEPQAFLLPLQRYTTWIGKRGSA